MNISTNVNLSNKQQEVAAKLDEFGIEHHFEPGRHSWDHGTIILKFESGNVTIFSNLELQPDNREALRSALADLLPQHRGFNPRYTKGKIRTDRVWVLHPQSR